MEAPLSLAPQPAPPEDEAPIESLLRVLKPLARSWVSIGFLAGLGAIAGAFYGAIQPNVFQSTGKILVQFGVREQITADTITEARSKGTNRGDMFNEIQILTNPALYEAVAREVGPENMFEPYDPAAKDAPDTPLQTRLFHQFQSWWFTRGSDPTVASEPPSLASAARALTNSTRIGAEPGSTVISVSNVNTNPGIAQNIVQRFLESLLERHQQVFATEPSYNVVAQRKKDAKEASTQAYSALQKFRKENQILDFESQRTTLLNAKQVLDQELATAEHLIADLQARYTVLTQILAAEEPTLEQREESNPLIAPLEEQRSQLERQRSQLLVKYPESSVEVQSIDRELETVRGQLAQARENGSSATPTGTANPEHQRLQGECQQVIVQLTGAKAAQKKRVASAKRIDQDLQALQACEAKLFRLENQYDAAAQAAQDAEHAYEKIRLAHTLDRANLSNLRVIQDATYPIEKAGPNRKKYLLALAALGGVVGVVLAYVRSAVDQTFRSSRDVERVLGLPVVAVVPENRRLRSLGRLEKKRPLLRSTAGRDS